MNGLILAGSRGPDDPLAQAAGVRHKALLPIHGVPMLLRVVRTLLEHPFIMKVYVSIEDEGALTQSPELAALMKEGRLVRIATAQSPAASLSRAIEEIGVARPIVITTGDHPLLTREMIEAFLESPMDSCDLAVAVAPAEIVAAAHPGALRTFYRLGSRRYSGCNLFLARTAKAARVAQFWSGLERFRKQPFRLILEIGPMVLLGILMGIVDLDRACRLLSKRVGADIKAIVLPFAEAAIDVDKIADWHLVEEILAKRESRPGT